MDGSVYADQFSSAPVSWIVVGGFSSTVTRRGAEGSSGHPGA
ncbi:hypothetical protein ACFW08_31155 [Streptomyces sp. NPDC058960]